MDATAGSARRSAPFGVVVVGVFVCAALLGPWLAPYAPDAIDLDAQFQLPSVHHWLGTADNGTDVLSVLLHGARLSGLIAVCSVGISLMLGGMLGALAGYRGGSTDHLITGLADLVQAFPAVILNIAILALVARPGLGHVVLALSANGWVLFARIARAQTLLLRESDFVGASRLLGAGQSHILIHHIAPNTWSPLLVQGTAALGAAVLAESTLSFLGLGPGAAASWGALLDQGSAVLLRFPHVALIAGSTIALTVLGFNLAGDFVRDRMDPRLRRA
jgi:ABC-type dipeptide/oligopeptide/nickel transport system permease subunit